MIELSINKKAFVDPILQSMIDTKYEFEVVSPRMLDKDFAESVEEKAEIAGDTGAYAS